MGKKYSRLQCKVNLPLKIEDLTFKFIVIDNSTKKVVYSDGGTFDKQGFTKWFHIFQPNRAIRYDIYYRGEVIQRVSAKAYSKPNNWSLFDFKITAEMTKKVKENIKEIHLNDGEVAWYLIKKQETVGSWAGRVFKKPLSSSDWNILKANNPHLANLVPMGVLQPGQVVVLSNSTTAKKLEEYKKQAQQAQKKLEEMNKDKDFDPTFFAQNYEFLYDALEKNAQLVEKNKFDKNSHPLTVKFKKDDEGFFEQKMAADAALTMSEARVNRVYKLHSELVNKYIAANIRGTPNAAVKFSKFRQDNIKLINELTQEPVRKFLKFDQSIKTTSMRKILNQAAMSRNGNYKGGMKDYVKNMGEIGKATKYLKRAGYLSIAVDVVDSSIKVYEAESSDRVRTTVVETAKVSGGIGAGIVVSAIVFGLSTGGTGFIVLGCVALTGAVASKAFGDISGAVAGGIYDIVAN